VNALLEAVTSIALLLSPQKISLISRRLRGGNVVKALYAVKDSLGTPVAKEAIATLKEAWGKSPVSADELAGMLLAASHACHKVKDEQSLDLVWTGPTTCYASTRRTEQVLVQVIDAAQTFLFITSFVAYDISSIVKALNGAISRGVDISMLLESSLDEGGSISVDAIGKMKTLVPAAKLYTWKEKDPIFADGRVHAKIAVADSRTCFITSANLTGFAMERNMEMGVLIRGGDLPSEIHCHLKALVDTKIIKRVDS